LNSRRIGIIRVLRRMGADIKVTNQKSKIRSNEPQGDITVKGSELRGTIVKEEEIPSLIDELPILMVAASFAKGKTEIYGVSELRVKETDRINSMLINLRKMGLDITHKKENEVVVIRGANNSLKGAKLKSFRDHRTAMSLIIAALAAKGKSEIDDIDCINKSFPKFLDILFQIRF
jgi:3-phosphoshikimate 1-carboxyvinyltransferase